MSLEISLFTTFDIRKTFSFVAFVACLCKRSVQRLNVWLLSPDNRGFGGFTISSLKMISNVSHGGTSDRMCPLSAVYIVYITEGGGYVDMWTYLKWRPLCWCFAC